MEKEINVLALVKGKERYVFLYDDANRVETLRTLGRFAADPQLSFTWYDAAVLSKRIREMAHAVDSAAREVTEVDQQLGQPRQSPRFSFRHEEDMI